MVSTHSGEARVFGIEAKFAKVLRATSRLVSQLREDQIESGLGTVPFRRGNQNVSCPQQQNQGKKSRR